MRRIVFSLVLVLSAVLALSAVAAEPLYLWRVEGKDAVLHMTGSIHVGKPDFFPLPEPIEKAFAEADLLAVEVDVTDPAVQQQVAMVIMQKALLPGEETLQDHLNEVTWTNLQKFAEERGLPLAMYSKFRPSIVALILTMEEYKNVGYDPELGVDKHFIDQAKAAGKPVHALETAESQMNIFLEVTDTLDDLMIDEMLDQLDRVDEIFAAIIGLWQKGDAEGMDRYMAEQTGDDPEMVALYRRLLDDRNVAMAETLDAWLKGGQDVFVAVGAGHFGGDKGLVKLLEDKGWDVQQVSR
jgi:uncharacterized protein YbaP (TraB family)